MSYVKTTWVTGDIVTAPKLNNLESGVEANDLNKLNKPSGNGTAGQLLISNGDGTTSWESVDSTLEVSGVPADAKTVGDEIDEINTNLEDYAKIDGYYEDLTAGNAEELVTGLTETESVPFLFRTAGGSLEIGAREDMTVTGGSLAWNQIVLPIETGNWVAESGATISISNGEITISSETANNGARMKTYYDLHMHKYYLAFEAKADSLIGARVTAGGTKIQKMIPQLSAVNTYQRAETIYNNPTEGTGALYLLSSPNTTYQNLTFRNVQVIDLTALFGTTIADYIYSLEQSTAGAGVAYFKKLFPKDYYPYQAADLVHVNASEFKTVGFNQCSDTLHTGHWWNANGVLETTRNLYYAAIDEKIKALPQTSYCVYIPDAQNIVSAYMSQFDANGNYISMVQATTNYNRATFTTDENAHFITFGFYRSGGVNIGERVCISIHWDSTRDGEYEPYTEHSYPLDSSLVLRGLPKIDTDGNLYYDGDTYEADGTVTRRYGIVDLGTLTWAYNSSQTRFTTTLSGVKVPVNNSTKANIICSKYPTVDVNTNIETDKTIGVSIYSALGIKDLSLGTDAAAFKTAMSGVYLVYELATPTTETADPYQTPQIVDNWGTEEFVVTAQNGVEIPVGHSTVYPISLKDKLEASPDLPASNGDYVLRMNNNSASYVLMASEFPAVPTTDGTYTLKATVSSGTATLSWVADA